MIEKFDNREFDVLKEVLSKCEDADAVIEALMPFIRAKEIRKGPEWNKIREVVVSRLRELEPDKDEAELTEWMFQETEERLEDDKQ